MSFVFLFALQILAVLFVFKRAFKKALVCLLVSVAVTFFVGTGVLPKSVWKDLQGESYQLNPKFKSSNGIVVLGFAMTRWGDDLVRTHGLGFSRLFEAQKLYHLCKKTSQRCKIILSGGDPLSFGATEADTMAQELLESAIPKEDLILESKSLNTFQNAKFSSEILLKEKFEQVFLVTSGVHMKRSLIYFSRFGISPEPAPSEYFAPFETWIPMAANFAYADLILVEYVGLLRFYIYEFMGWNKTT